MNRSTFIETTIVLVLALGVALSFGRPPEEKSPVSHANAKEAAAMLKKDPAIVVLDIRRPSEYEDGHIAKAKNIDFYADDFEKKLSELDKSKTYLVHCASGGRSTRSLPAFQKLGFKSVVHLDGGFKGWAKDGQPVEK